MPEAARKYDLESGSCPIGPSSIEPPLPIASGAGTVLVNGMEIARSGDPYMGEHVEEPLPHPTHPVFCGPGSATVFAEGKPVFRKGDQTTCLSVQVGGSGNVIVGG